MANPNIAKAGKKTQFKPGVSGNPQGRPKGTRNWSVVVRRVLQDEGIAKAVLGDDFQKRWDDTLPESNLAYAIAAVMAARVVVGLDVQAANWLYKVGGFENDRDDGYVKPETIDIEEARRRIIDAAES